MGNGGTARVVWGCARAAVGQGAVVGAFDARLVPGFGSTRWLRRSLGPARVGVVKNVVVHPVRFVEQKAKHVGQRGAFCDREKGRRRRVPFVRRVRMC